MDLYRAVRTRAVDEVQQALDEGADINYHDTNGRTSLSWAVVEKGGNKRMVKLLLKNNSIDLNSKDNSGRTPLSWAAERGGKEVVALLLEKENIDLDAKDNNGRTPLSWVAERGSKAVVELLLKKDSIDLNSKDNNGRTPLLQAVTNRNKEVIELLLKKDGIDLNSKDNDGRTLLSYAAVNGYKDVVEILLKEETIDLNSKDNNGRTPLLRAVANRNKGVVELLVKKDGIDLNSKDKDGRTPLSWAVSEKYGSTEVVELLLEKDGIDLNSKDNDGRTPLSWAVTNSDREVVELVLKKDGIDLNSKDNDGRTPLWWLAKNQWMMDQLLEEEVITLHTLVLGREESLVQLFLNKRKDVNKRDSRGKTPLHIAVSCRSLEIAIALISFPATNINSKDNDGITPLRLAIQTECAELIGLLLKKSALAKGIMAREWRKAYRKQESDIVMLSERKSRETSVSFITEKDFLDKSTHVSIEGGTDRRLFLISDNRTWQSRLIPGPKAELESYRLEISLQRRDGGQSDSIYVAIRFPPERDLEHPELPKTSDWECRIAWRMTPPSNLNGDRYWKSLDHFSMMQFGWIPDDGVDFFKQFILCLKERWLKLCDFAKDHLTFRRLDQLSSEGRNPEIIRNLANDAQRWAKFRSSLQHQVRKAQKFAVEYSQLYSDNHVSKDMQQVIGEFEATVSDRINELDQTVRDLLQIEFAWVSMSETRISTRLGQNVMLLTYVSIFYLPLGFCAALWAIPNITDRATWNPFVITATLVGLLTLVVAFNLDIIVGLYFGQRASLVKAMRKDVDWKELGTMLQGSSPNRRTPSDWWLVVYLMHRSIRRVGRKKGRNGDMESMPHGGES